MEPANEVRSGIADALFSATQQRLLSLLFGQPERRFVQRELIELAASGTGAVQRQLAKLVESGLVAVTTAGNQKLYQADARSPVFQELCRIVEKTLGVAPQLKAALAPVEASIRFAALYGSVAAGADTAASDIDVLIVSDELSLEDVFRLLAPLEERLGRRISPTLYTSNEVDRRLRRGHPFLKRVLGGEHVVLFGYLDAA